MSTIAIIIYSVLGVIIIAFACLVLYVLRND